MEPSHPILFGIEPIPHIGVYQKEDYKMMGKLLFHQNEAFFNSSLEFLPFTLKKALESLENREKKKEISIKKKTSSIQYFDGSLLKAMGREKNQSCCRLNYVVHPVIFKDKTTYFEEKIWCNAGLFTFDEHEFGLVECKKENQHLAFNLQNMNDGSAYFEVHIHQDDQGNWMFSPNNVAFQAFYTEPIINFAILSILPDMKGSFEANLSWNSIIWDNESDIVKGLLGNFLSAGENHDIELFENFMGQILININGFIDTVMLFFNEQPQSPNFLQLFAEFYSNCCDWNKNHKKADFSKNSYQEISSSGLFDAIFHFIQRKFKGTKVGFFGQELLNIASFELKKALLLNYFKFLICNILHSLCFQCLILNINCDMIVEQKGEIMRKMKINEHEFNERKPIYEIVNYVLEGNFDIVGKIMKEKMIKPLENLVYEQTWIEKGRIQGISSEFGRYSFLNDKRINGVYHCSPEECCEILMDIDKIIEEL